MRHYTITRNGETIGTVTAFSRVDAANIYAARLAPKFARFLFALDLHDGTWQAMYRRPKLARFETVSEPFAVEAAS